MQDSLSINLGADDKLQLRADRSSLIGLASDGKSIEGFSINETFGPIKFSDFVPDFDRQSDALWGARLKQTCDAGTREIHFDQYFSVSDQVSCEWLSTFELNRDVEWEIRFPDAAFEKARNGLHIISPSGVRCVIHESPSAIVSDTQTANGAVHVKIALAAGHHAVKLSFAYANAAMHAQTAILCLRHQVKEAAIVRSTIADTRYVPIFVCSPITMPEAEYLHKYKELRDVVGEATQRFTKFRWGTGIADNVAPFQPGRQDALQAELEPTRSSVSKNNKILRTLLTRSVTTVVVLFDPSQIRLTHLDPGPLVEYYEKMPSSEREPNDLLLSYRKERPEGRIVRFLRSTNLVKPDAVENEIWYDDLTDLAHRSCRLFRNAEIALCKTREAPLEQFQPYFSLLFQCRLEGAILLPSTSWRQDKNASEMQRAAQSREVVCLVEVEDDVDRLIGVEYAATIGADLVLVDPKSTASIEAELQALDKYIVTDASRRKNHVAKKRGRSLWAFIRSLFFKPYEEKQLLKISSELVRLLPRDVVKLVGSRRVTAFTKARPYHLLTANGTRWINKPIGVIPVDADLVLNADQMDGGTADRDLTISLLVDAGYFQNSETDVLFSDTKSYYNWAMVFDPQKAIFTHLFELALLPLKFVLFNTHGDDGGIMWGPQRLPRYLIANWLDFRNFPVVLNNSCTSWIGVGREFLRAGAARYIGSLWSVDTFEAAAFAERFSKETFRESRRFAEAVAAARDSFSSLAYVYVGTSEARDRRVQSTSRQASPAWFRRIAERVSGPSVKFQREAAWLGPELDDLVVLATHAAGDTPSFEDRCDIARIMFCALQIAMIERNRNTARIFELTDQILALTSPAPPDRDEILPIDRLLRLRALTARATEAARVGRYDISEGAYKQGLAETVDRPEAKSYFLVPYINTMMDAGRRAEARQMFEHQVTLSEWSAEKPDERVLIGILTQMYRHEGKLDLAWELAVKGLNGARTAGDRNSQGAFLGDQSNILSGQGHVEEALACSQEAAKIAQQDEDINAYLVAAGQIVQLLARLERLDEAEVLVDRSIGLAATHAMLPRLAILLEDKASIKFRRGEFADAARYSGLAALANIRCRRYSEHLATAHDLVQRYAHDRAAIQTIIASLLVSAACLPPELAGDSLAPPLQIVLLFVQQNDREQALKALKAARESILQGSAFPCVGMQFPIAQTAMSMHIEKALARIQDAISSDLTYPEVLEVMNSIFQRQ